MSALPEWSRNGTRKLALTSTGTLLPYTGSFYFCEQIHRSIHLGGKHCKGPYVGSLILEDLPACCPH